MVHLAFEDAGRNVPADIGMNSTHEQRCNNDSIFRRVDLAAQQRRQYPFAGDALLRNAMHAFQFEAGMNLKGDAFGNFDAVLYSGFERRRFGSES